MPSPTIVLKGAITDPTYFRSVHQSARGLVLWHRVIQDTHYTITLRRTEDTRREGDLSVLCFVNDFCICVVSFSYVNSRLFGLRPGGTMFVTRSQTVRNVGLQRFRDTFKQNSPPYFCLAAVCGIAMANGMHAIFTVKHDAQLAYAERYAEGFRSPPPIEGAAYELLSYGAGTPETGVATLCQPPADQLEACSGVIVEQARTRAVRSLQTHKSDLQ